MSNDVPSRSRRTLWLVAAVCIAPFVASFRSLLFLPARRAGQLRRTAGGEAATAGSMKQVDGGDFSFAQLQGKWLFVMVDDATCNAYCEKKLWQIRQVRKTAGQVSAAHRTRLAGYRQWPAAAAPARRIRRHLADQCHRQHTTRCAAVSGRAHRSHLFWSDPLGNLVLRYPRDADPSRMRKDLERLLKVSRIG